MDISNKIIIVSGASQGIGLAIAKKLIQKNAKVIMASRNLVKLQEEAAKLGQNAFPCKLDITNAVSIDQFISYISEKFGRIDVLINNAGYNGRVSKFEETNNEEDKDIIETHIIGSLMLTKRIIPVMKKAEKGLIVNFASIVGFVPMKGLAVYSAAKAAMIAFSTALHDELTDEAIDVKVLTPFHTTTGFNIGRATTKTPEDVADFLMKEMFKPKIVITCNNFLPTLQRFFPKMVNGLMKKTGDIALELNR